LLSNNRGMMLRENTEYRNLLMLRIIRSASIVISLIVLFSSEAAMGEENISSAMSTRINTSNIAQVSFLDNITGNLTSSDLLTHSNESLNVSAYSTEKDRSSCLNKIKICNSPFNSKGPCADYIRCMRGCACDYLSANCFCEEEHPNDKAAYDMCVEENTGKCDCEQPAGC